MPADLVRSFRYAVSGLQTLGYSSCLIYIVIRNCVDTVWNAIAILLKKLE